MRLSRGSRVEKGLVILASRGLTRMREEAPRPPQEHRDMWVG